MSGIVSSKTAVLLSSFIVLLAYLVGQPANRALMVLGFWRRPSRSLLADDTTDLIVIADTINCEDLHYHAASHSLFTACEDTVETRFSWFPPLAILDDPSVLEKNRGSLHVIDPETATSRRLTMHGFTGPFCTHGIDVLDDPDRPDGEAVYIYAVNHLANPDFPWDGTPAERTRAASAAVPKARSRIEVFHHVVGSSTATHLRSVQNPLIRTPNDIFAASPRSFYVTNDHRHREGLWRAVEDVVAAARWSNIVRVDMDGSADATNAAADPTRGITAAAALEGLHNPNGLGHGRTPDEMLVSDCSSGVLNVFRLSPPPAEPALQLDRSVRADSVIDNPSYFADPYSSVSADSLDDRSGYVLPGVSHGLNLSHTSRDPAAREGVIVRLARHASQPADEAIEAPRLLFQDDGSRIRSASAAVLLAIDPKLEGGRRRAWLFVTGFQSVSAIAVKVDL